MKTMTFNEFYEVYTNRLIKHKYTKKALKHDGYKRIYESGDVYEHIAELKPNARTNWDGLYQIDSFNYTSKLNGIVITKNKAI